MQQIQEATTSRYFFPSEVSAISEPGASLLLMTRRLVPTSVQGLLTERLCT